MPVACCVPRELCQCDALPHVGMPVMPVVPVMPVMLRMLGMPGMPVVPGMECMQGPMVRIN